MFPSLKVDPDDVTELRRNYKDEHIVQRGAYELAHYAAFGVLPDETEVIERIEEYPAGRLIIHLDRPVKQ
jgi:hypothetical protein